MAKVISDGKPVAKKQMGYALSLVLNTLINNYPNALTQGIIVDTINKSIDNDNDKFTNPRVHNMLNKEGYGLIAKGYVARAEYNGYIRYYLTDKAINEFIKGN